MESQHAAISRTKVILLIIVLSFPLLKSLCCFGQPTLEKGKILYAAKKYPEAEKIFQSVEEENKEYAVAQFYLGRIAFDKKEYDEAADFLEEATEFDPKAAEYFCQLGNAYAEIAKNANMLKQSILGPKAKDAWEKAALLDPQNIDARISLIKFYKFAPGFMGGGMSKAKATAAEVTKLNEAEGHWQMGNLFAYEKNTAEAEKEFSKMLKANPDYNKNLAVYYSEQKQYDKAFALLEEVLKKNAEDYSSLYQLGKASALSGLKLERGEECLKKYLTHIPAHNEPSTGGAYMRLGQIKEKKGSKAEAKKYYELALKQDENLKEAEEGLARTSK